jgi:hypothetical protein
MPLLTELEKFWSWISTNMSPLTGLALFRFAALPYAATAAVSFSGQTFLTGAKSKL